MRTLTLICAAAVAALLSGAAIASEEELLEADKAFAAKAEAEGAEAAYAAYGADDLRMFTNDGVVSGERIAAALAAKYPGDGKVTWTPGDAEVSGDGSMGFTIGEWSYAETGGATTGGSYVSIWKKVDGAWKLSVDADTTGAQ